MDGCSANPRGQPLPTSLRSTAPGGNLTWIGSCLSPGSDIASSRPVRLLARATIPSMAGPFAVLSVEETFPSVLYASALRLNARSTSLSRYGQSMSRSMKTRRIGNSASAWISASSSRFTSAVPGRTGSRPSSSRNHSIATTIESRMLQPLISKLIIRPALRAFGRQTAFEQTVASDFMTRGVLRVGFRPAFERELSCPLNATAGARPRSPRSGLAGGREEMAEREGEEEEDAAAHGDEPRVQEPERRPSEGLEVSPQTADQHVREEQVQVEDADHQTGDRARR